MISNDAPNIIIPCCGNGARFGALRPKHLIDIAGRPMMQRVLDMLPSQARIFLLVRPEHEHETAALIHHDVAVVPVSAYARGAAETVLGAVSVVGPHLTGRVLVVNCDNVIVPPQGWTAFL